MEKSFKFDSVSDPVDMELSLGKNFKTVYSLAYCLVDLNAVVNTFYRVGLGDARAKYWPITSRFFSGQYSEALMAKCQRPRTTKV